MTQREAGSEVGGLPRCRMSYIKKKRSRSGEIVIADKGGVIQCHRIILRSLSFGVEFA